MNMSHTHTPHAARHAPHATRTAINCQLQHFVLKTATHLRPPPREDEDSARSLEPPPRPPLPTSEPPAPAAVAAPPALAPAPLPAPSSSTSIAPTESLAATVPPPAVVFSISFSWLSSGTQGTRGDASRRVGGQRAGRGSNQHS